MYHANKVNDLARDHQQMKVELEGKKKELLENLNEQNKENNDIADQFEVVNEQLKAEKEEKEQIMSELERYKVYLPEAEGLLQEVNNRHQGALDEIEQQQKIAA
jgi:DNA repair exonuclease SbcCD ATPase subunit